jgi:hypothetical protein
VQLELSGVLHEPMLRGAHARHAFKFGAARELASPRPPS